MRDSPNLSTVHKAILHNDNGIPIRAVCRRIFTIGFCEIVEVAGGDIQRTGSKGGFAKAESDGELSKFFKFLLSAALHPLECANR